MGKIIFKVYTCIIFKQYTCFFKGLLVKYLMVDIEIKNMEYGIWNCINVKQAGADLYGPAPSLAYGMRL